MTKKRASLLIILIAVAAALWFAKKTFYDPRHKQEYATKQVQKLIDDNTLREGDIIFQTSLSSQSQAIQTATHSPYSHCGLVFKNEKSDYYVLEAVQPVKTTPLDKWIARGKDGSYVVKRLKNANEVLTDAAILRMKSQGNKLMGKPYDLYFEWTDEKMYCSEMIWKLYLRATGVELGKLQELKEFDLSDELVKQKMHERYGDYMPIHEKVISPAAIFNCDKLIQVADN